MQVHEAAQTPTNGSSRQRNNAAVSNSSTPKPVSLNLPEAVELLVEHFRCTEEHARDLLERAVYGGSLKDITTFYPDGTEIPTKISDWQNIDWDSGYVTMEPSYSGSPAQHLPVIPLLSRDELYKCYGIHQDRSTGRKRGGRPLQHDWDAFWTEVCRRIYEDGLPKTQQELVVEMLAWTDGTIDQRTIEKKLSRLLAVLKLD